jgi:predicted transcriptional regulator
VKYPEQLTPAEYGIIQILWDSSSPLSVSQVLKILCLQKPTAYTTAMTLLDKMTKKGSLERVKKGKAYYYHPRVRRSGVLSFMIQKFTDQYFDGEKEKLTAFVQKRNEHLPKHVRESNNSTSKNKSSKRIRESSKQVPASHDGMREMDVCLL